MSQQKKVALITGANKGIGLEIARQLGEQQMTVLIGARDYTRVEEAAKRIEAYFLTPGCDRSTDYRKGSCVTFRILWQARYSGEQCCHRCDTKSTKQTFE